MRSDPTFWLLARATGIVAYVLLTVSVLAGLLVKSRPFGTRVKPALAVDIHRTLALLSLTALAGHGLALVLDHTVEIGVLALLRDLPPVVDRPRRDRGRADAARLRVVRAAQAHRHA